MVFDASDQAARRSRRTVSATGFLPADIWTIPPAGLNVRPAAIRTLGENGLDRRMNQRTPIVGKKAEKKVGGR